MIDNIQKDTLINTINLLLEKYNIKLVELNVMTYRNENKFKFVLFNESGLSLDMMEKVHLKIDKFIEKKGYDNYSIELSSPGINRIFKSEAEYNIFKNKRLKLILKENKIVEGINKGLKENKVTINNNNNDMLINVDNIIKAKLA